MSAASLFLGFGAGIVFTIVLELWGLSNLLEPLKEPISLLLGLTR